MKHALIVSVLVGIACPCLVAQPPTQQSPSTDAAAAPVKIAGREVRLSADAKQVLDRAAAAYHSLKTYRDATDIETLFVFTFDTGDPVRMPSRRSTVFAYGGPRHFTLRGDGAAVYGQPATFTNQIRSGRDEKGQPTEEKEVVKLSPEGPVDWADCMGSLAQTLTPTPVCGALMTGPTGSMELFLEADTVEPGDLDERPGTWVKGKGICPHTPGSRGGKDVVPIAAWFSAKTGRLWEIRYDISKTSWAVDGAESMSASRGPGKVSEATVTVRIKNVKIDEPVDEGLFVYSPNAAYGPILGTKIAGSSAPSAGGAVPMVRMGGGDNEGGTKGMVPAVRMGGAPGGGMTPAVKMTPKAAPDAAADKDKGEIISPAEAINEKFLNQPAPAFAAKTPDGKDITLADFKGKVVMMDFWATWCGPCMQAIPGVQRLSQQFKDQPVAIIGINRDKPGDEDKVRKTIERKELTFHQAMDGAGTIGKTYKVTALPTTILIDKGGVVRMVHVGSGPGDEKLLAAEIEKLLKGE